MGDEAAIQQVLNRYSLATSQGDLTACLALFIRDAAWVIPAFDVRCEGHDAIMAGFNQFNDPMDYFVQINSPAVIAVHGDRATAHSVIRESGKYKGLDQALDVLGVYHDRLVRTADGWMFSERLFELRGLHRQTLLSDATAAG